jgi:succinoglycan biosynthesis protein ExoV
MKIHLLTQVGGNFGDELNRWLWPELLGDATGDARDDVLFIGIGTILDRHLPPARVTIVFGTGVGYTSAPHDLSPHSARWRIYGVRGPMTARALKLDRHFAMTDPAILLATFREFSGLDRRGTLFIPHWKSVRYGNWEAVCKKLGIEFVHPCKDSRAVVRRIASAEKVIAESMHAAIIADAFRVPWVPVALSREVSPFKWVDWTSSVNVPYRPVCLPASTRIEYLRNSLLKWSVFSNAPDYPSTAMVAQGTRMNFEDPDVLMSRFEEVGRRVNQRWRWSASMALEITLKRLATIGLGTSWHSHAVATAHLDKLRRNDGFLSSDHSHARALEDTLGRLEGLKSDLSRRAFRLRHLGPAPFSFEATARELQKVFDHPSIEYEYRKRKDQHSQRHKYSQAQNRP